MSIESDTGAAAEHVVRVPAGVMQLLRQSYDSREKVLDWIVTIAVVGTMAYVFRHELRGLVDPDRSPDAGLDDAPVPNQDVRDAFPRRGVRPDIYTYNLPPSRGIRTGIGPAMSPAPGNPACPPSYRLPPSYQG